MTKLRSRLYTVLVLGALIASGLCSCASYDRSAEAPRVRFMAGPGYDFVKAKVDGETGKAEGYRSQAAIELTSATKGIDPMLDVGIRIGGTFAQDYDTDGQGQGVSVGLDSSSLNAQVIFRRYFSTHEGSSFLPFLEGGIGYGHRFANVDVEGGGLSIHEREDDGDLLLSAAAGLEFLTTDSTSVFVQVGYDWQKFEKDGVKMDFEGVGLMLGGEFRF